MQLLLGHELLLGFHAVRVSWIGSHNASRLWQCAFVWWCCSRKKGAFPSHGAEMTAHTSDCFRSQSLFERYGWLKQLCTYLCCIIEACQTVPYQSWAVISKHRILWHVHINIFLGFLYLWQTVRFGFHGLPDVLVWLFHLVTKCFLDWGGNVAVFVCVTTLKKIFLWLGLVWRDEIVFSYI